MESPDVEAEQRYRHAVALAAQVRAEWEQAGLPLLVEWSNGQVSEHPFVKLLRECERDCERFSRVLLKRPRGRPPVAVVEASVGTSPAARLRSVG